MATRLSPGSGRNAADIGFDQFYAAVQLQRIIHDRNATGLTERRWRIVWACLTPSAKETIYLLLGVGLSQDQAAAEIGCTRNNVNLILAKLKTYMIELVTAADLL